MIHVKMINQEVLPGKNSIGVGKRDTEEKEAKQVFDIKQKSHEGQGRLNSMRILESIIPQSNLDQGQGVWSSLLLHQESFAEAL